MSGTSAVDLFSEWARLNRDEGMERGHSQSVDAIISAVLDRLPSEFTAIDLGCGNGWAVRRLKMMPSCIFSSGVDGSEAMVSKARSIDPEGEYFHGMIPEWSPNNPVNLVLSMEFMYYLKDPISFFKTLYGGWLLSGGSVAVGVDHYLENESSLDWSESLGVHMTTLSSAEWEEGLRMAGFQKVESFFAGAKEGWNGTLVLIGTKP
jgi:trans-aconitate methyltransferase